MHCLDCGIGSLDTPASCPACGKPYSGDADTYFKAGMRAMAAGDNSLAVSLLQDCLHLDLAHVSGRYNLGLSLALSDRFDEALDQYAVLAETEPEYPGLRTAQGQAAFGSYLAHREQAEFRYAETMSSLLKAVHQDSSDVDALFSLGNAHMACGEAKEALRWLRRALHLDPGSAAIRYVMARALDTLGHYGEAAAMAEKSMELAAPDDLFLDDLRSLLRALREDMMPL